ncbi:hypothetical protein JCM15415_21950 [Methanobacterium movens]
MNKAGMVAVIYIYIKMNIFRGFQGILDPEMLMVKLRWPSKVPVERITIK